MLRKPERTTLFQALLCGLAFMVFSFFIHYEFPVRLISFAALLIPAVIFVRTFRSVSDLKKITGEFKADRSTLLYALTGMVTGILLAVLYRTHLDIPLFPKSIFLFSAVAAFIGTTEELVFRGFIQDYVKNINSLFAIIFSSLAHTGYKCALFLSPVLAVHPDIGFLAFWTFAVGLLLGTLRHFSGNVLPCVLAHALFDILVYSEYVHPPWWVW